MENNNDKETNEIKNLDEEKINTDKEIKKEIDIKEKTKIIFHENLEKIKKIQKNVISSLQLTKEKITSANEISIDQIKEFKENSNKYGKYLKLIHGELVVVQDLMK
jgi:hypothetical protein